MGQVVVSRGGGARGGDRSRLVRLLAVVLPVLALAFIPLQIVSCGYMPIDDALRHVAKAITGRPWSDILVMRDGMVMDSHPGWHALLTAVHHATGADKDLLVVFSVVGLALVFLVVPLFFAGRPENWVASLCVLYLVVQGGWSRPFFGRPFVLTMAAVAVFCLLSRRLTGRRHRWGAITAVTVAVALSVWLNCTWYLWVLPVAAMLLAGRWRGAARTTAVVAVGVFVGACLSGNPLAFLWLNVHHLLLTVGQNEVVSQLVAELQPQVGPQIFQIAALLLLWRRARGRRIAPVLRDPAFALMALTWFLGVFVGRFLLDWAFPACLAWMALELRAPLMRRFPRAAPRRLALVGVLCATCFALYTRDNNGRWSNSLHTERLSLTDPAAPAKPSSYADWMPETGGILYSDNMQVFYSTFYANPDAKWRYILGFEPGWMPEADLKTYRNIQWAEGQYEAYQPWINKMRPQDRLVLAQPFPPALPALEWRRATREVWIGRLRRPKVTPSARARTSGAGTR